MPGYIIDSTTNDGGGGRGGVIENTSAYMFCHTSSQVHPRCNIGLILEY